MLWKRLKYLIAKVRRAWSDGTLREKASRFLFSSFWIPLEVTVRQGKLAREDRRLDVAAGFTDHRGTQGHHVSNPEHLRRIIAAYNASKQAQQTAPQAFQIRGLWAEWIDINFKDLIRALREENTSALAAMLENLHREQFTLGLGGSFDEYIRYRTSLTGRFYARTVWCRYRDKFRSIARSDEDVRGSPVGNPAGIHLHGEVIPIQAFRHAYHALEMGEWLRDRSGAVVVEIGGGIGAQAFQVMRRTDTSIAKYLVFDIPEAAAVCSYLLLSAFPDKRIRLFGEGPVSTGAAQDYDLAIFPHFTVTELADESVDLFHNACSFSEMDRRSSRAYLGVIERACRGYFSHINHDTRIIYHDPDGSTCENALGSELTPDPHKFRRIFKKPRVFYLPEDRWYPAFEYLYERRNGGASPR
ncbi:MAG: putative sugar O-methyltransferase [Phycisphaerales bacterium]